MPPADAAPPRPPPRGTPLDFPVALRLDGRPVLLVGAGRVAEGRARQLLEVGARLHVVAPEVSEGLKGLARAGALRLSERPYRPGDCNGVLVVFTAASDPAVNRAVVEEAREHGVLVNAADAPELCDFHVPSIGRRGPVTVAVSTAGLAPGLSRVLRTRLLAGVGPEWGQLARLIGRLRRRVSPGPARTRALEALVEAGADALLREGQRGALFRLVRDVLVHPERRAFQARSRGAAVTPSPLDSGPDGPAGDTP